MDTEEDEVTTIPTCYLLRQIQGILEDLTTEYYYYRRYQNIPVDSTPPASNKRNEQVVIIERETIDPIYTDIFFHCFCFVVLHEPSLKMDPGETVRFSLLHHLHLPSCARGPSHVPSDNILP